MLPGGGLSLCSFPLRKPQRLFGFFGSDRVRPRITKAKPHCSFLGGEFRWRFDYGAQWTANLTGVFAVSVVDAPEMIAWLRRQRLGRFHDGSSAQPAFSKMYQIHKMRVQSP